MSGEEDRRICLGESCPPCLWTVSIKPEMNKGRSQVPNGYEDNMASTPVEKGQSGLWHGYRHKRGGEAAGDGK